jgi:hypothetical protein
VSESWFIVFSPTATCGLASGKDDGLINASITQLTLCFSGIGSWSKIWLMI